MFVELSKLWDAAQAQLAKQGRRLTLDRVSRESGVPVATLSDWRRGNHVPREAEQLLKVVRLLSTWAELRPPAESGWRRLMDGSAAPAATKSPQPPPFGVSIVALGDRLTAAFAEPHVEVDALCLNGQTLAVAMGHPLRAVHSGKARPAKISVRVLLPSRDIDLAFPCAVESEAEETDHVHQAWLRQRNAHAQSMTSTLRSLQGTHGIDVEVSYRALPFTPMARLYLINGKEALFSYYTVTRREVRISGQDMDVYDPGALGLVQLFGTEERDEDTMFVEQSNLWFNAIWETVSTEMTFM
ncbi:GntR family transcriptional regulator [Streptomyces ferrugineus]|uniref:GntR family transcriptional regulator n=1 Tax=Streptomyces ferrugineus TaxID=1413221 RepID=A0A7M2SN74_9ACTN|nr:GntR family transcriptional regulator [Streptomyces ferrugineus]QOV37724.1 GntR family transcriptional regulator [Streptomyces ferrugineus]